MFNINEPSLLVIASKSVASIETIIPAWFKPSLSANLANPDMEPLFIEFSFDIDIFAANVVVPFIILLLNFMK